MSGGQYQQHPMYQTYSVAVDQYLSFLNGYVNPSKLKHDLNEVLLNYPTIIPGYSTKNYFPYFLKIFLFSLIFPQHKHNHN